MPSVVENDPSMQDDPSIGSWVIDHHPATRIVTFWRLKDYPKEGLPVLHSAFEFRSIIIGRYPIPRARVTGQYARFCVMYVLLWSVIALLIVRP